MPTSEELQQQVDLLSNELSNQAEQFAKWRAAVSAIAAEAIGGTADAAKIAYQIGTVCGA